MVTPIYVENRSGIADNDGGDTLSPYFPRSYRLFLRPNVPRNVWKRTRDGNRTRVSRLDDARWRFCTNRKDDSLDYLHNIYVSASYRISYRSDALCQVCELISCLFAKSRIYLQEKDSNRFPMPFIGQLTETSSQIDEIVRRFGNQEARN